MYVQKIHNKFLILGLGRDITEPYTYQNKKPKQAKRFNWFN